MPAVAPGSKVLVTGASGFIAAWVVKVLLERGFHVRGTVRSSSKGNYLAKLFTDYAGRFEYVVVEDIAKEGAFDEAVKGVYAVEHIASPFHLQANDPDEIIRPAVQGTRGVLESVLKHGLTVQRVVITSSMAAIMEPQEQPTTYSERDWNNVSPKEVATKGREASPLHKYRASKTLAERAAWAFAEKHKGSIKWDVVAFNPPLVWGPIIHDVPSASSINTSVVDIYDLIKGNRAPSATPFGNWVDVRDVAHAHAAALTNGEAGGERFILASGPFTWQNVLDSVHQCSDAGFEGVPRGAPGAGQGLTWPVLLDTTKARTLLGVTFRPLSETGPDTVRSLLEREQAEGW